MKIPAHLLSPVANNKGAQNAPLQSVAEFLHDQSEAPMDFSSALKTLQNLGKPQKDGHPAVDPNKNSTSGGDKSVAKNVAELKFADPKIESVEQETPGHDGSVEPIEVSRNTKTTSAGSTTIPGDNSGKSVDPELPSKFGLVEKSNKSERLETVSDPDKLPAGSNAVDIEPANKRPDQQPGGMGAIASALPASALSRARNASNPTTEIEANPPRKPQAISRPNDPMPAVHKPTIETETRSNAESTASIVQVARRGQTNDETLLAKSKTQFENRPAPNGETQSVARSAIMQINQSFKADKADQNIEVPVSSTNQRAEFSIESRPASENAPQIQLKGSATPQLASTNMPASQTAPLISAKDISSQVTRHLNSELLNMDLRTQVVSERAITGALNTSVLTLQLHPVGLGRVQAEIRREGELVRIKLTVEASGTFETLKNDLDALKAAMRALGTSEGDVTLTQGNINRLPNEAANNGQNFFSNDRDAQSELRERQNGDANGSDDPQSGAEENTLAAISMDQTLTDMNNTVFI